MSIGTGELRAVLGFALFPVITISSKAIPSTIETFKTADPSRVLVIGWKPIDVNCSSSPLVTCKLNLPSKSVLVPVDFPFIFTETPGKGSELLSVTVPETLYCAIIENDTSNNVINSVIFVFIKKILVNI